jgi:flagellar basal body rod protein FlgG
LPSTISNQSIAQSGMVAAMRQLDSAAHNIANQQTEGFRRQQVVSTEQSGGGVTTVLQKSSNAGHALETDVVSQLQSENAFAANLAVFKTHNRMAGALLDESA